jgi:hypothetical protein
MQPEAVKPVKYFVGALFSSESLLKTAIETGTARFGQIDRESSAFLFKWTDYYEAEMGKPIYRKLFSFEKLMTPDFLAAAKLLTNEIEQQLAIEGKRKVNLDIGYLDYDKVVLASAKYGIHKIYLNQGIYADLALHYEKGKYSSYPWAFLDFQSAEYRPFFLKVREIYKTQIKILNDKLG